MLMKKNGAPKPWQLWGVEDAIGSFASTLGFGRGYYPAGSGRIRSQHFSPSGAAANISPLNGSMCLVALDQACTISVQEIAAKEYQEVWVFVNPGVFAVTWGNTITWMSGTAPTLVASTLNVIKLWTMDSWGTVFGEAPYLGVTFTTPTFGKASAAYTASPAGGATNVYQFNMVTEAFNVVIPGAFYTSGTLDAVDYGKGMSVANKGYGILLGNDETFKLLDYATHAVYLGNNMVTVTMGTLGDTGAVQWEDDYKQASFHLDIYDYNTTWSIETATLTRTIVNYKLFDSPHTYSATISMQWEAKTLGSATTGDYGTGSYSRAHRWHWTVAALQTAQTMTYAAAKFAGFGHDKDTGLSYFLGGYDQGTLTTLSSVLKHVDATQVFSSLGNLLPIAVSGAGGSAQDGTFIWAYRNSNPVKFTVATETAAVGTTTSVSTADGAVIHGDTMEV